MRNAFVFCAMMLWVLVAPRSSAGQGTPPQSRMSLSIGAAQSRLSGEDAEQYGLDNDVMGMYVGIATDIPILGRQMFRFGPGARYISRGYEVEVDHSKTKLNYLEVIAPLIIEVPLFGGVSLNLSGGPGVSLSMGCKISTKVDDVQRSLDCQNEDPFYKSYDFTGFGAAGLSYGLPNGPRVLLNGGLDVSLKSIDATGEDVDFRNRSLLIGAQATFPLGRRGR
jgi:hypothetical protein